MSASAYACASWISTSSAAASASASATRRAFHFRRPGTGEIRMSNQVVVITGASSGIGAALAELLAGRGMDVVLVARRQDALEAVAARCNGRALVVTADVTVRAEVRRVVETTLARFHRIDVWVNNAGVGITRVPSELTDEDID